MYMYIYYSRHHFISNENAKWNVITYWSIHNNTQTLLCISILYYFCCVMICCLIYLKCAWPSFIFLSVPGLVLPCHPNGSYRRSGGSSSPCGIPRLHGSQLPQRSQLSHRRIVLQHKLYSQVGMICQFYYCYSICSIIKRAWTSNFWLVFNLLCTISTICSHKNLRKKNYC